MVSTEFVPADVLQLQPAGRHGDQDLLNKDGVSDQTQEATPPLALPQGCTLRCGKGGQHLLGLQENRHPDLLVALTDRRAKTLTKNRLGVEDVKEVVEDVNEFRRHENILRLEALHTLLMKQNQSLGHRKTCNRL